MTFNCRIICGSCTVSGFCSGNGFFGISGGQFGGAGLAIIGLVALVFFFAGKRKKKN